MRLEPVMHRASADFVAVFAFQLFGDLAVGEAFASPTQQEGFVLVQFAAGGGTRRDGETEERRPIHPPAMPPTGGDGGEQHDHAEDANSGEQQDTFEGNKAEHQQSGSL
jgi:hypothetical protein